MKTQATGTKSFGLFQNEAIEKYLSVNTVYQEVERVR
jgi:hypothetical protein